MPALEPTLASTPTVSTAVGILHFTTSRAEVMNGDKVTFDWETKGATHVKLVRHSGSNLGTEEPSAVSEVQL